MRARRARSRRCASSPQSLLCLVDKRCAGARSAHLAHRETHARPINQGRLGPRRRVGQGFRHRPESLVGYGRTEGRRPSRGALQTPTPRRSESRVAVALPRDFAQRATSDSCGLVPESASQDARRLSHTLTTRPSSRAATAHFALHSATQKAIAEVSHRSMTSSTLRRPKPAAIRLTPSTELRQRQLFGLT